MNTPCNTGWPSVFFYWADLQKEVFRDLHYNRFTYYPLHDKARIDRQHDSERQCTRSEHLGGPHA